MDKLNKKLQIISFIIARHNVKKLFLIVILLSFVISNIFSQTGGQESTNITQNTAKAETKNNADNIQTDVNDETAISIPQTNAEEQFQIQPEQEDQPIQAIGVWDTIRVFIVLGFVIAGIYGFVWGLKKLQKKSFVNSDVVDVISSRSLTGGGNVHLVKLGKTFLLLGASSQNVSLLKEISDKEEVDQLQLDMSSSDSAINPNVSFWSKIKSTIEDLQPKKTKGTKKQMQKKGFMYSSTAMVLKELFKKQDNNQNIGEIDKFHTQGESHRV